MMPKPKRLRITKGTYPASGRKHPMLVTSVTPDGSGWQATLIDLSDEHLGREHVMPLPAEAPPDGAIADLFRACGLLVQPEAEIDPREAAGKTVCAVFYTSAHGESRIIGFQPYQETKDGSAA